MNSTPSTASQAEPIRPARRDAATRWRKLLEDQRASGLPITAFCRERGIAASSLFAWRRRLTRVGTAASRAGEATFQPVTIVAERKPRRCSKGDDGAGAAIDLPAASCIELCLRGERRLIVRGGFDRQLLKDLICALELLP